MGLFGDKNEIKLKNVNLHKLTEKLLTTLRAVLCFLKVICVNTMMKKTVLLLSLFLLNAPFAVWAKKITADEVHLASISAIVVDLSSGDTVLAKNSDAVVPIASISKLMSAMVLLDAKQPLDESLAVSIEHIAELQETFSRLRVDSQLKRRELLLLSLMSSENRATATLANHYPGGMQAFVAAMNEKAKRLGMFHSYFVEPTGLSEHNISTAEDLVKLVKAAHKYPLIRQFTTTSKKDAFFASPSYALSFYNTNPLVRRDHWDIALSKTGFINEAGRCLVMMVTIEQRELAVVLLDSFGKRSPVGDANRIRHWMETGETMPVPKAAERYAMEKLAQLH